MASTERPAGLWITLQRMSEKAALVGGLLLIFIAAMVTVSVFIRSPIVGGRGVPGDFELVQMGTAVCAFCYLALCQARRGNIFVDTFTSWLPRRAQAALDALWDVVYGMAMTVLAWRLLVGAASEFGNGTTTMVLGIPTGIAIWVCGALAIFVSIVTFVGAAARFSSTPERAV